MNLSGKTKRMVLAAMFLALGLVLPFVTLQIPAIGQMLCPMHIPVMLCGIFCGWQYGLVVGFITPLLRSVLFGMPQMYPTAIAMAFELAVYGIIAGILYKVLPDKLWRIYATLIGAMISGRIAWGIAQYFLAQIINVPFTLRMFLAGAVITAIPGIVLHIILIPLLVRVLEKAKMMLN